MTTWREDEHVPLASPSVVIIPPTVVHASQNTTGGISWMIDVFLKTELVYTRRFATRAQAQQAITEYIELFYNRQRTQARLGYLSPATYTARYYADRMAA